MLVKVFHPDVMVFDLHDGRTLLEPATPKGREFLDSVPDEARLPRTPAMEQRGAIFIMAQANGAIALGASLRQIYTSVHELTKGGDE